MKKRKSGILLHITSLPSRYGIGDLGPDAYKFVDFLRRAKQSYWQVLPLNPPALTKNSHSPYNCLSAFAGNNLLISPVLLYRKGYLTRKDLQDRPDFPEGCVNYRLVISYKTKLLHTAFKHFKNTPIESDYRNFCSENADWLEDYATFAALHRHFRPRLWCHWPSELRDKKKSALYTMRIKLQSHIEQEIFFQYLFFNQWFCLKDYCNQHKIKIIGDIPIYVDYDSTDVWAHPNIFKLNQAKRPQYIAGVPPDYFSRSGQLWGNPVYNWKTLKNRNYSWWQRRIEYNLSLFDMVRIDHFRGFFAYWQVKARAKTARSGRWVTGPQEDFLEKCLKNVSSQIIAEDLGFITPDVTELLEKFKLRGMRILLFAFNKESAENPHFLKNHIQNSVVYTGTHDNNTARGWWSKEASAEQKQLLLDYLGRKVSANQIAWEIVKLAMSSIAEMAIIPMQDVLGLGEDARMNRPATVRGNWRWQLCSRQTIPSIAKKLASLTKTYERT
ncbi:4-alpha-glucanotransferase [Planctomycetota bacterium]